MKQDSEFKIDTRWMLLEQGCPHTVLLTEDEVKKLVVIYQQKNSHLDYSIGYDEYYEFSDLKPFN